MPASMNAMPENEGRWLLLDEQSGIEPVPVAVCADIDGLFVDGPAPPRERFTLIAVEMHRIDRTSTSTTSTAGT